MYRIGPYQDLLLGKSVVIDDHVNIRKDPSTQAAILMQIGRGTSVFVLGQTDKPETIAGKSAVWYHVRLWDRTEGWVFGAFLDIAK